MFTIFHLFELAGAVGGVAGGAVLGYQVFGLVGGLAGPVLGLLVGRIVGRLPFAITMWLLDRDLKSATTASLRERLQRQYFISHLIIAELVVRGEPLESFRDAVRAQLSSGDDDVRRFGLFNAEFWFPDMAPGTQNKSSADAAPSPGDAVR